MTEASKKEMTGAWVIRHGRKLSLDANGSAEFPAIDEAAKAVGNCLNWKFPAINHVCDSLLFRLWEQLSMT